MRILNYRRNMVIKEFFKEDKDAREHWTEEIKKSDWRAAWFLVELLTKGTFHDTLGEGELYLLTDENKLMAFVTMTRRDCIVDDNLFPWIGFVYTFPESRGNRYSELLINNCADIAKKKGFEKLWIATDHDGLYEKYGFVYLENRIDCWGEDSKVLYRQL